MIVQPTLVTDRCAEHLGQCVPLLLCIQDSLNSSLGPESGYIGKLLLLLLLLLSSSSLLTYLLTAIESSFGGSSTNKNKYT
jgi:hypothetical protein